MEDSVDSAKVAFFLEGPNGYAQCPECNTTIWANQHMCFSECMTYHDALKVQKERFDVFKKREEDAVAEASALLFWLSLSGLSALPPSRGIRLIRLSAKPPTFMSLSPSRLFF